MKLFCRDEMQRLEMAAVAAGTPLSQLMDRAGAAVADQVESRCRPVKGKRAVVLCGRGNNGGDGFVCAGLLARRGMICTVVLAQGEPRTDLARAAYESMPGEMTVLPGEEEEAVRKALEAADVVVDCVFGFSFRGELSGTAGRLLGFAAGLSCLKVSADLPSGVECDTGRVSAGAFRADVTVTFTGLKPANVSYPAKEFCGETVVAQVGVPAALMEGAETRLSLTDEEFPREWLREADPQANKGDQGKLLLVCGSWGMAGACIMAAKAALRCGVGLLQIAVEERLYPVISQAVPQAVYVILDWDNRREESEAALLEALERCSACVMGCGLGERSELVCPMVFSHCRVPLLADADAINFLSRHPGFLEGLEIPLVLTPHPGEMARLCDDTIPEIQSDRLGAAQQKARETGAVVALKGAATVVAAPDGRCAVNPTGNPGMAKGGSGDVLAGMAGAFLAQGLGCYEAAVLAVYLHGMAGDLCAQRFTQRAMLPTDLPDMLPQVFRRY
ncbi:MAG: NAD(P)H-hydrate dehydratase [Acutalibacter sp.]|jgi:hydroxyethylthiazole kinase-like uncharacterized protein yjeF